MKRAHLTRQLVLPSPPCKMTHKNVLVIFKEIKSWCVRYLWGWCGVKSHNLICFLGTLSVVIYLNSISVINHVFAYTVNVKIKGAGVVFSSHRPVSTVWYKTSGSCVVHKFLFLSVFYRLLHKLMKVSVQVHLLCLIRHYLLSWMF